MAAEKQITFLGNSLAMLRGFPESARKQCGVQLHMVQQGLEPDNWKPMSSIGPGVREIRIRDVSGAFRIIYVTKIGDTIFVLHAFQKKTRQTAKRDLDIAASRLKKL